MDAVAFDSDFKMDLKQYRWPWSSRVAVIAATTAVFGWILWRFGPALAPTAVAAGTRDEISAVGSAMMSAASLSCIVVIVLVGVDILRRRRIKLRDGMLLIAAHTGLLIDAVVNAH